MTSRRVSEPVQVYLDHHERARLTRLKEQLGTTQSDVLRRALLALEQQLTDPKQHPVLRLIGICDGDVGPTDGLDPAVDHDQVLADAEVASWSSSRKKKPRGE